MNKLKFLWVSIFLLIWEIIAKLNIVNPLLFPSLENILKALIEDLFNGSLLAQIGFTL